MKRPRYRDQWGRSLNRWQVKRHLAALEGVLYAVAAADDDRAVVELLTVIGYLQSQV